MTQGTIGRNQFRRIGAVATCVLVAFVAAVSLLRESPRKGPTVTNDDSREEKKNSPTSNDTASPSVAEVPSAPRPGFRAVTAESGIRFVMGFLAGEQGERFKINLYDHGCGLAAGDVDGDGDDDLYFCNQLGGNSLWRNDGRGKFEDATRDAGPIALDDRVSVGATFADYDNDGDQDLFVTSTRGGNSLFQNDGRGVFRDVTREAGVGLVAHSQTGTFFDYDLDGDLDLLVTNSAAWTLDEASADQKYFVGPSTLFEMASKPIESNVLYRNEGNGTFVDVTVAVGCGGLGWAGDTAVFDYDEDGRPDVLITNMFGRSQLYRNEPSGVFRDVTREVLGKTSWGAIGAVAADFTNDGRLDLFIADMHSDMWTNFNTTALEVDEGVKYRFIGGKFAERSPDKEADAAHMFNVDYEQVLFGNTFFRNQGEGKFVECSDEAGAETFWPWGLAAGDFDNDGFQDVFLPAGMGYPFFYWPNNLLMNQAGRKFLNQSRAYGIEPRPGGKWHEARIGGKSAPKSSRCAVTMDFDGDGRLDLIVGNFNDAPYVYRNEFMPRNYVRFRLRGERSNRDAIGAMVTLHVGDQVQVRQVNPAGGYLSHSSKTLHFGLGDHERIDRVEIRWPSGARQTLENPAINQLHEVRETP